MLWLVYLAVAITVVVAVGIGLRATRLPVPFVAIGQAFALLCLAVAVFSRSGLFVILPGPAAMHDLATLLQQSMDEIQTGVPPVAASPGMRCLIVLTVGLVAIVVDTLAVGASAPAASGLVLLCVFAVPASLSDAMLPWWSFVLGAGAFALLLAVDGQHRHDAWRGRSRTGSSSGSGPTATTVASLALVVALIAGATLTFVGTVGRLPGGGNSGGGAGGIGLKPMTSLRGLLNQGTPQEVFRVKGLPDATYLRAVTLRTYAANEGWKSDSAMDPGVSASGPLPPQAGDDGAGKTTRIEIEPVGWTDNWLPIYGEPRKLDNVDDSWRYDKTTGVVYSQRRSKPGSYVEQAVLGQPTSDSLRAAGGDAQVDRSYTEISGVDPRVSKLAADLTQNAGSTFDKVAAINRFFNGQGSAFKYSTQTKGDLTSDALYDFVFNGKTGFCEQYASAMAVMLRTLGIPTRVAIGFTGGFQSGDSRTITTQDAHAWVEVFFAGYGWMTFDPTPLSDGRGVTPPYMLANTGPNNTQGNLPDGSKTQTSSQVIVPSSVAPTTTTTSTVQAAGTRGGGSQPWIPWTAGVLLVIGALAALVAWLSRRPTPEDGAALPAGRSSPDDGDDDPGSPRPRGPGGVPGWVRRLGPAAVPVAVVSWGLAAMFAVALVSWWLAVLALLLGVAATPSAIRRLRRRRRLRAVAALGSDAAGAAWQELLAESLDRGTTIPASDTVRAAARRLAREHSLDEQGRDGLRAVIGAIELSWYGRSGVDPALPKAVDEVRRSLGRNAPLALRAKVLPRSVLHAEERRDS
ncbi:transglutaminase domain-containing protein [Solihabitans fulvus]|uniref:Transglutaminase domain-containing protein n=2 Tax=Solihabitans fulvus TaxID=1892852 RepID=A0A5B2X7L2_9PSEU|nr:transglutaminase domain-containing protein [Solihabitans fulvus]